MMDKKGKSIFQLPPIYVMHSGENCIALEGFFASAVPCFVVQMERIIESSWVCCHLLKDVMCLVVLA